MLKARFTEPDGGGSVMLIGLSALNIDRLMSDKPIIFDGAPFGYDGKIILTYGPTDADIARQIPGAPPVPAPVP